MTKIYPLMRIIPALAVAIIISSVSRCTAEISDKRLCSDAKCSEPVSLAKTLLSYSSNDPRILSFPISVDLKVFSKSAGKRKDLWGVEINGKRGYVPKSFLKEYKVLKNKLTYEVPTEPFENPETLKVDEVKKLETSEEENETKSVSKESEPLPVGAGADSHVVDSSEHRGEHGLPDAGSVSPSYEVVDGTTIPLSPNELPTEPNYATQTPWEASVSDEQPVLSILPNLASNVESFVSSFSNGRSAEAKDPEHSVQSDGNVSRENESKESSDSDALEQSMPASGSKEDSPLSTPDLSSDNDSKQEEVEKVAEDIAAVETNDTLGKDNVETSKEEAKEEEVVDDSPHEPQQETEDEKELPNTGDVIVDPENLGDTQKSTDEKLVSKDAENPASNSAENNTVESQAPNSTENESVEKPALNSIENESMEEPTPNSTENKDGEKPAPNSTENKDEEKPAPDSTENKDGEKPAPISTENKDGEKPAPNSTENKDAEEPAPNSTENEDGEKPDPNSTENKNAEEPAPNSTENESPHSDNVPLLENITNPSTTDEQHVNNESLVQSQSAEAEAVPKSPDVQDDTKDVKHESAEEDSIFKEVLHSEENTASAIEVAASGSTETMTQYAHEEIVNNSITDSNLSSNTDNSVVADAPETNVTEDSDVKPTTEQMFKYNYYKHDGIMSYSQQDVSTESISTFNEKFSTNRNLLNVEEASQYENNQSNMDTAELIDENNNLEGMSEDEKNLINEDQVLPEDTNVDSLPQTTENILTTDTHEKQVVPPEPSLSFSHREEEYESEEEEDDLSTLAMEHSYWETLLYLGITAFTALVFSLGYYYIENTRRDGQLIAKINNLEKELLVASKEVMILDEGLKTTKSKLNSIEDESFGSNEMVASLKSELEASQNVKLELEDQIATLEKELEGATEAGLELERMLREFLSSQSDDNPLAQSVEDLQTRLNAQQATNETLTESLNLKTQENEALLADLATATEKCQQLDVEVTRITEELKFQTSSNNNLQKTFNEKIQQLDMQIKEISKEKAVLNKDLMAKKMEVKDLWEVVNQVKDKSFDFEKLCDVSHIKADAKLLLQERDELKSQLAELEGAHSLLEEHMKIVKEEIASVTRHCESAEKEKKEALTRLEVLTNFFEEKENQRYKEEAIWLQKEGEATSTVERIQTLQNEIQNYKQQIETLKKEIVDQEREYKNQISALETKAHEQWVHARQNERRLEESKAEASQLRNRLTLVEKNMNEVDPENKLHRLETNGETAASPQLYLGPETSSSPIMFTGSSGIPPPPPSYMFGPPLPPFLPPPPPPHSPGGAMFDISQRPPPLGGRLSSPPPPPLLHPTPSRYDNAGSSPPPPLTPPLHNLYSHRSPPPMPFGNDRIPPPLPPLLPPLGTSHWGDETLPLPPRNSGFHPIRELRGSRNHKGSLHSSGDSLDKSHHSGKA